MARASYVNIYQCEHCGKLYQEKQVQGCNNQYPSLPIKCTYIEDFDLVRQSRKDIKICENTKFIKIGNILISGYRHYEEQDEHAMYLKKQLISKFSR